MVSSGNAKFISSCGNASHRASREYAGSGPSFGNASLRAFCVVIFTDHTLYTIPHCGFNKQCFRVSVAEKTTYHCVFISAGFSELAFSASLNIN